MQFNYFLEDFPRNPYFALFQAYDWNPEESIRLTVGDPVDIFIAEHQQRLCRLLG
jgi:hypothetical protein